LWATSWGDHRVDRFPLHQVGASWRSDADPVVQGDDNFRPVGFALAPDGSLFFSDWVDRSYPVHGKGRIWHLRIKRDASPASKYPALTAAEIRARELEQKVDLQALSDDDPFIRQAAIFGLVRHGKPAEIDWKTLGNVRARLGVLTALRWLDEAADRVLPLALNDTDPDVRLAAVRWVADRRLTKYRAGVENQIDRKDGTLRLYQAAVAALPWIDRGELIAGNNGKGGAALYASLIGEKADRPAALRAWALRSLSPDYPSLTPDRLDALLHDPAPEVRNEAVWTLALSTKPTRFKPLAAIALNRDLPAARRADAVVGLAEDAAGQIQLLAKLAEDEDQSIRNEANRILRSLNAKEPSPDLPAPSDTDAWLKRLGKPGDPEAGRRAFFSSVGAGCFRCHTHLERGGNVGPDLTYINRQLSQRRLLESILEPSKEVAPEFRSWTIETADGKTLTGLSLGRFDQNRKERFAASDGKTFILDVKDITSRRASDKSIMPEGLERVLTLDDLRDILAFLQQPVVSR
jgi:putative heme-binding domain-containing protein